MFKYLDYNIVEYRFLKGSFMKRLLPSRFCAGISAISAAISTLICSVFGAIMMILNFDGDVGYFKSNALNVIFTILCIGAVAWLLVAAIMTRTDGLKFHPCPEAGAESIISLVASAVFLVAGGITIYIFAKLDKTSLLLAGVFGVLAAFYHLSLFTKEKRLTPGENTMALLGYATVIFYICLVIYMYLDVFVTMNSPVKMLLIFALVASMTATLSDVRYVIGRELPRYSLAAHGINLILGCTSAVSTITRYITASAPDVHPNHTLGYIPYIISAFIVLTSAVISGARLHSAVHASSEISEDESADTQEEGI